MLVVHVVQLIWGFGNGGSWCRSVAWSTCFLVGKNMKCCGLNIEVSVPNVGIAGLFLMLLFVGMGLPFHSFLIVE
jgi:hypothetical protein